MAEEWNKPQTGSTPADPAPAASPPPSYSTGQTAGAGGGLGYDFKTLPGTLLKVLTDPAGSLEASYKPGKPALITGLIIGGASVILIPIIQIIFLKISIGKDFPVGTGEMFKQILGGVVLLAAGVGLSFILKPLLKSPAPGDWQLDVFLFGSSLLFLVTSFLAAWLIALINEKFFIHLAHAIHMLGVLLVSATYFSGLVRVAKADPGRAAWAAVLVPVTGLFLASLLNFPMQVGVNPEIIGNTIRDQMEQIVPPNLQDMFKIPR